MLPRCWGVSALGCHKGVLKMIAGYIDRIEEGIAVILLNDGDYQLNYPAELLPENLGEGDYINLSIEKDEEKQETMLQEALFLMDD